MKKSRLFLLVVFAALAVTLALSLASCGGDGDDTTTTAAATTTAAPTTTAATTTAVPEYKATFVYDDPSTEAVETTTVVEITFKKGDTALDPTKIPAVPAITGYVGEWEDFSNLPARNFTVRAVYTSLAKGSDGLVYEKNAEGTAYTVIGYTGRLKQVVIPASYKAADDTAALPVTAIGEQAFWGNGLVGLTLPTSVTAIGAHAFSHCTELETVPFPAGIKTIGDYAFFRCEALTSLAVPVATTEIGAYAFGECIALETLTFPADSAIARIGKGAFSSCTSLASLEIPTPAGSRTITLDAYAFLGCSSLTSLTLTPKAISTSRNTVFFGCTALEEATCSVAWLTAIPKESLKEVVVNEGAILTDTALVGAKSLISLDLTDAVSVIDANAFRDCVSLSSIAATGSTNFTINGGALVQGTTLIFVPVTTTGTVDLTGIETIGNYAFYGVSGITAIDLSNISAIGDYAFYGCSGIEALAIPAGCTVGKNAFEDCTGITMLNVAADCTVDTGAFLGCDSVHSAILPTSALASLPKEALVNVYVNAGDTIARRAFYGQTKLERVILSSSVTKVGQNAFFGCQNAAIFCDFASTAVTEDFAAGWNGTCPIYYAGEWAADGTTGLPAPNTPPAA